MAVTINWATKVITVPWADLVPTGTPNVYSMDLNWFRQQLKDLEDDEAGMPFLRTHNHNPELTIGGATLARVIEIINGYTVTFSDGQYAVNLIGANSNISDVTNVNQVSIRAQNSAGLAVSSDVINPINETIESTITLKKAIRVLLAVAAGKTTVVNNGGGLATVTFRDIADTKDRLVADMDQSERLDVTLDTD